jgi:hypothetical protein
VKKRAPRARVALRTAAVPRATSRRTTARSLGKPLSDLTMAKKAVLMQACMSSAARRGTLFWPRPSRKFNPPKAKPRMTDAAARVPFTQRSRAAWRAARRSRRRKTRSGPSGATCGDVSAAAAVALTSSRRCMRAARRGHSAAQAPASAATRDRLSASAARELTSAGARFLRFAKSHALRLRGRIGASLPRAPIDTRSMRNSAGLVCAGQARPPAGALANQANASAAGPQ